MTQLEDDNVVGITSVVDKLQKSIFEDIKGTLGYEIPQHGQDGQNKLTSILIQSYLTILLIL